MMCVDACVWRWICVCVCVDRSMCARVWTVMEEGEETGRASTGSLISFTYLNIVSQKWKM